MKRRLSILLLVILLFIGGGYFIYQALKIEIKAKLAQVLLHNTWNNTLKTGKFYQPWPSLDGKPILLLEIPNHNISQIVLNGTSMQNLAYGPSLHEESFLPHEQKVSIISSHRDNHGIYIKKLQLGDEIRLQDQYKKWHSYIIDDFFIINVLKDKIFMKNNDKHLLLVTCYPFNAIRSGTPYRYVVSAKKNII